MGYIFKDWQDKLLEFESSVKKDLDEIRKCKAEMQQMKLEMASMKKGRYISDNERLILSAPEIIIGHVDEGGLLKEGCASHVIVRGTQVDVHGIGEGGQVDMRAPSIRQIAEDPGSDGHERVVYPRSEVVSQARNITLQSSDAEGLFSDIPGSTGGSGIFIHADKHVKIDASVSSESKEEQLAKLLGKLKERSQELEKQATKHKLSFGLMIGQMEKLLAKRKLLVVDDQMVRSSFDILEDINGQIELMSLQMTEEVRSYADVLSLLAETSRQLKCLDAEKGKIKKGDAYKKNYTGAHVSIDGEYISLTSVDGEGNLRDNEASGISLKANAVSVAALEADGSLKKEGKLSVNAKNVEITTADNKEMKYDDQGQLTAAKHPVEGDVLIRSKNITLESTDYEVADKKLKEKTLTAGGKISVRAEKTLLSATDTEGKATGTISLNAKDVSLKSMDVDKDSRADKAPAEGGKVQLLAENMLLGEKDKSKQLQMVSEAISLAADKTLKAVQGDNKAVVELSGENASVTASKVGVKAETSIEGETQIKGDTKIKGDTEVDGSANVSGDADVKGEVKASKGTFDKLEAKLSFKSMNIQD
ncbi:MAG: hypothetical protein IJQ60_03500 [Prevotella sp.]|nr:hypothetical protein [Prevotella sp.]